MNCKDYIFNNLSKIKSKNILIKEHPEKNYDMFVIEEQVLDTNDNAYINLKEVVGTNHPNYKLKTWLEALKNLKRMDNNLSNIKCSQNLGYYNASASIKQKLNGDDPWSADVYLIDNRTETYITQGNNRTIVSKFLYEVGLINEIVPVTRHVTIKKVDKKIKNLYQDILNCFNKEINSNKLSIELIQNEVKYNNSKKYIHKLSVTYLKPYNKWAKIEYSLDEAKYEITNELKQRMSFIDKFFNFLNRLKYNKTLEDE